MNSMTGFGKSEIEIEGRKLRVEIKSVNNRFLDVNVRQPRFMIGLEDTIRQFLKDRLARGRVDVFINYYSTRPDAKKATVDAGLVTAYVEAARQVAAQTGLEDDLSVSQILRMPDAVTFEEDNGSEEELKALLIQNLEAAVSEMEQARRREGAQLWEDVASRLRLLEEYAAKVGEKSHVVAAEYKQKLHGRIAELLDGAAVDEQRLAQEVAFFADKADVTEEVVRVKSHVEQFLKLAEQDGPQGRNMDFLVQELNREFNTMGSKSQDTEILNTVIAGKAEIEKIREQIQNIE